MADVRLAAFTIFDTPILNTLLRVASRVYLKITGWKLVMEAPVARRSVVIAAPHTSNWDMPMSLALVFACRIKVYFLAKHTLFTPPFGLFLRWLGGIPVNRSKANNLVEQAVELFSAHDDLVLVVPPEGTRKLVRYWKNGFYHIAYGAQVPISLGFIDFKRKIAGFGGTFIPTGNYDADLVEIQSFYAGITGKNRAMTNKTTQHDVRG
ncbi:MAG: lysophospholipid acyltransferase family protein [Desulfuromonadaceae bacterium]|nr:lysophospholipid acyltransferase family protein [Desulfuromonadaceae bacterium]